MKNMFIEMISPIITQCQIIMGKAGVFYSEPLSDLKLKASPVEMYEKSDTEETLGDFIANIPRPGDVAACLPRKRARR